MLTLRPITPADNAAVARVIRTVMPEFGCVGENFSISDPEVDDMAAAYAAPRHGFFVVEGTLDGDIGAAAASSEGGMSTRVLGCAGFAPLTGGDPTVCELRKMYMLPKGRGRGGGGLLMEACLAGARAAGFTRMYLETVTTMTDAAAVYAKYGFRYLDGPMGATGHGGCDRFMIREI